MGDATEEEVDPWWMPDWVAPDTPLVNEIIAAIAEVYKYHGAGGNLHVYIDDGNLEDHWFEDREQPPTGSSFREDSPEQVAAERKCWNLLKKATVEERFAAYLRT